MKGNWDIPAEDPLSEQQVNEMPTGGYPAGRVIPQKHRLNIHVQAVMIDL
jgi:hypothetical protein